MLALMPGPLAAFAFFLVAVGGGERLRHEFSAWNLQMLERLGVIGGLYRLTIVPPLSYLFCRNIFSRQYWHFPRNSWKWICALALVQLVTLAVLPPQAAFSRLLAFNSIVISPLTEEIMRAVMIFRLIERWGPFGGIAVTTTLFSVIHKSPLQVVLGMLALSLTLVYTNKSIAATAVAHSAINAVILYAGGLAH